MKNPFHISKKLLIIPLVVIIVTLISCSFNKDKHSNDETYKIPKLKSQIIIDGKVDDWNNEGYRGRLFANQWGEIVADSEMLADFRLGWIDSGLYIYIHVSDDSLYFDSTYVWNGDGVEIFLQEKLGEKNILQWAVAPGNTETGKITIDEFDYRNHMLKGRPVHANIVATKGNKEYAVEAFIPFSALDIKSKNGSELAFQLYAHDKDLPKGQAYIAHWHCINESYKNLLAYQRIILADKPDEAYDLTVKAFVLDNKYAMIKLIGQEKHYGQYFEIISSKGVVYKGVIGQMGHLAVSTIILDVTNEEPLKVKVGKDKYFEINLPYVAHKYYQLPQPNSFETDIKAFEIQDKESFPDTGIILFVGSSSIRMWTSVQEDMGELPVINRGFGGSTIKDLLWFANRIVIPYKPKAIVCYEGSNDITSGTSIEEIVSDYKKFLLLVKDKLPGTHVFILGVRSSIARKKEIPKVNILNNELKKLSDTRVRFIDDTFIAFDNKGVLRSDILIEDKLHMNKKGYDELTAVVKPILEEFWKKSGNPSK